MPSRRYFFKIETAQVQRLSLINAIHPNVFLLYGIGNAAYKRRNCMWQIIGIIGIVVGVISIIVGLVTGVEEMVGGGIFTIFVCCIGIKTL